MIGKILIICVYPLQSAEDEEEVEEKDRVMDDEEQSSEYREEGVSVIERVLLKGEKEDQLDTAEATEVVQGISCSKLLYKLKAVEEYLRELEGGKRPEVDVRDEEVDGSDNRSVASSTTSTLRGHQQSSGSNREGGDSTSVGGGIVLTENMKQIVGQLSEICGEVSGSIRERSGEESVADDGVAATKIVQELLEKVSH